MEIANDVIKDIVLNDPFVNVIACEVIEELIDEVVECMNPIDDHEKNEGSSAKHETSGPI